MTIDADIFPRFILFLFTEMVRIRLLEEKAEEIPIYTEAGHNFHATQSFQYKIEYIRKVFSMIGCPSS